MSKKIKTVLATIMLTTVISTNVLADTTSIVSIGADLTEEQVKSVYETFGINEEDAEKIEINNQMERKYLLGIVPEEQIGTKTISCAYVKLLSNGAGINVKTNNLTYVTTNMLINALTTAGVKDAEIIATAPYAVSGTGALTGIMAGYEKATGEELSEDKKEAANEEIIATGQLSSDLGDETASAIMNDVKEQVIKEKPKNDKEIAEIVNNVGNNYNINLNTDQSQKIVTVMSNINKLDYNYDDLKNSLNSISNSLKKTLEGTANEFKEDGKLDKVKSFFKSIGDWFKSVFEWIKSLFTDNKVTTDENGLKYDKDGNLIKEGNVFIDGETRTPEEIKAQSESGTPSEDEDNSEETNEENPNADDVEQTVGEEKDANDITEIPPTEAEVNGQKVDVEQKSDKTTEIDISDSINIE